MKMIIRDTVASIVGIETFTTKLTINDFDVSPGKIPYSLIQAKGDLIVGTGAGAATILPAGTLNQTIIYDSAEPGGLKAVDRFTTYNGSAPNVIINGDFDIWQRGTSFAAIATGAYHTDRFLYGVVGTAVHTITKDTDVPTFAQSGHNSKSSLKVDCTTADASIAAGDLCNVTYKAEGYDYAPLKEQTITLSFFVKATKVGTYCVAFCNSGADRSYVAEYTINAANTWEKKTVTVALNQAGGTENYTNGTGIRIVFSLSCGSTYQTTANTWQTGNYVATSNQVNATDSTNNNFWLSQVKLELGSVATPFVSRPYGDELRLCKRYCRAQITSGANEGIGFGSGASIYVAYIHIPLEVEMRDIPSLVATASDWQIHDGSSPLDLTVIAIATGLSSPKRVGITATVASGCTPFRPYWLAADGVGGRVFILSAEL